MGDTVDMGDTDTTEARGPPMPNLKPKLPLLPPLKLMLMLTTDTDTVVDTTDTDVLTDTTEARGLLMLPPKLVLLPPLKPKLMLMLTTDTDTVVDTTAVDTTDTDVLTDTTEARGLLMLPPKLLLLPPLKPKLMLMLTTDTDTV